MAGIWVGADELLSVGKEIAGARREPLIRLVWTQEGALPSQNLPALVQLAQEEGPSVILFPSTVNMNEMAARLAYALNCPFISGCIKVGYVVEEDCLEVERLLYGGAAVQVVRNESWPVILSVSGGEKVEVEGVKIKEVIPALEERERLLERREKAHTGRSITEAKVVVSVGRGLKSREDLSLIKDLAVAVGGEIGCTRPLASELNWLPESACIGLSGVQVNPDVYIALGISGQIQHVVGMRGARVVVAVNKDEKAPIFGVADFGIVGDLYSFIPLFLMALNEKR
ncbi:MAG TPA: electron transfer flavoprotein subunit alpha/FixB family protein [Syntrophales bacterium]|nr:electron transfer flavoprotein subunit alpha/FixB family protein [Syntrophales bacterium]HOL58666.1 electron transfer flavoprotein subunit alpha/FixB family protein [Syntrophales bacterium]HPO35046.1 electron transfer flavoprotein subunit alpha/FixB family protein [Syntrophales bacterium]